MKYVLVTGGVISGIGKGVVTSSIGKILKSNGYEVTAIKIDPYINIDAGTFSPYEHGEVFVLDDGGEVDLDLGNYERFMDIKLHRNNNITTGKIYQNVISKERRGDFLGKTVQVVPHITDAIQEWVEKVALEPVCDGKTPEICIIELGGTIGDIEGMPFVEAFSQFRFRVGRENFCCVHVSLVPKPKSTGEHKTKPTQTSVRDLRRLGLSPDLIICRSESPIDEVVKQKISNFCHVSQVICLHDVKSLYHVPIFLEEQGLVKFFHERLQLVAPAGFPNSSFELHRCSKEWRNLARKCDHLSKEVRIALVGKYTGLEDSYASVTKALQHASLAVNLKIHLEFIAAADLESNIKGTSRYHEAWRNLCMTDGVLVPGGFGTNGIEGKIAAIQWARKNNKPFLGICLGFQLVVVEFARNVLGWENAHTEEIDKEGKSVVIEMLEHHTGTLGGTMRLGKKVTMFRSEEKEDSVLWKLYGKPDCIEERHRHRYEVNKNFQSDFERAGLRFVGEDEKEERLEILELSDHPYFVAVQFHPEYISRPLKPSPPYLGLILAACGKLPHFLIRGRHSSSFDSYTDSSDEEFSSSNLS